MPIFSSNRVGTIRANENYNDHDCGRILYECAINDQIVFNRALANDFREIDAMREGTMLESELRALREFNIREAWSNLKKKVEKLWQKIKGVFRSVFAKLTVWFVRDGKKFVKLHRSRILSMGTKLDECEIKNFRKPKKNLSELISGQASKSLTTEVQSDLDNVESLVTNHKTEQRESDAIADEMLKNSINSSSGLNAGKTSITSSEFQEEFMDAAFDEASDYEWKDLRTGGVDLSEVFSSVENGGKKVKDLKKAEDKFDKKLKSLIKKIDRLEGKADSAKEKWDKKVTSDYDSYKAKAGNSPQSREDWYTAQSDEYKSGTPTTSDEYKKVSTYVSGVQTWATTLTAAQIKAAKFYIKQNRMLIGRLGGYSQKVSFTDAAMAWLEAADDFDTVEDIQPSEVEAPDVQEGISEDPEIQIIINTNGDVE